VEPVIVEVFRYHCWANASLIRFCESLTPGQLASSALGTYGEVYKTLRHIAVTEQWYVADIRGEQRVDPIASGEAPDVRMLGEYIARSGQSLIEVAAKMSMTDYARWSDRGQDESMLAVRLAIQALDHGSEHRAQVRTILSQIGIEPPEIDGWAYDAFQPDKGDYLLDGPRNV
jgi:uncharacterized damage-inducible protein DinB